MYHGFMVYKSTFTFGYCLSIIIIFTVLQSRRFRNPSFIIRSANIEITLSRLHTAFGIVPKEYNRLTVKIYLFGLRREQ